MRPRCALWAVTVCLGCCTTIPDRLDPNLLQPAPATFPQARLARLRAAAAVFYSREFVQQSVDDRGVPGISHRAGPASVALFDRVLEAAFEQVLRLPAWPLPAGADRPEVALVFVPRIAGIATVQSPASAARLIEYRIEAFTPGGERVDAWTIHAKSRSDGAWNAREDKLYPGALRDAAAQLLTSIADRPALKAKLPGAYFEIGRAHV